ncbi:contactin-associated protein-like 2 [Stylophora pistillata]|uniref:contactin-associated protein-like 2 n=1 Tax=Stylophora pistillata TaxID=50429 RepID=UPI000C0524C8|nr:contactin-associated protein-like 2 [Stylophora pistillata]
MLLLPLLLFFPLLLKLMFAMQNSALYRYPTGRASFGKFKCDLFHYLWEGKLSSSMVEDKLSCTCLCVGEPKCYSFNIAANPDSSGLHLCELLATDKYRVTDKLHGNNTFHHFSPTSPCESTPCKNSDICVPEYQWNSYRCGCKPGFHGINCDREGRTCSDIKRSHPKAQNGDYLIDPDGNGKVQPFRVYCDMTDKDGVGVPVVSHDSESRTLVDGFKEPGSYLRNVTYHETNLRQLASLTASSAHCEQFIMYECYDSRLFRKDHGWWVSRDGEKMKYWGGVDSIDYKCACGLTNTCADPQDKCNCDKNDNQWRNDSGLLTDKSRLPVKQLRFGDTGYSSNDRGYHTLGKLKCFGLN